MNIVNQTKYQVSANTNINKIKRKEICNIGQTEKPKAFNTTKRIRNTNKQKSWPKRKGRLKMKIKTLKSRELLNIETIVICWLQIYMQQMNLQKSPPTILIHIYTTYI